MVWALRNILLIAFLSGIAVTASADDYRALTNYKLHCQGCHMPDMQGAIGAVPRMKNFLGYFLHSPEGRGYIAQVPGVTMSSLKNDDLADNGRSCRAAENAKSRPVGRTHRNLG